MIYTYAAFPTRILNIDRLTPVGIIEDYPLLAAWRDALLDRESVKTSTLPDFEGLWRANLIRHGRWAAKLIAGAAAAE